MQNCGLEFLFDAISQYSAQLCSTGPSSECQSNNEIIPHNYAHLAVSVLRAENFIALLHVNFEQRNQTCTKLRSFLQWRSKLSTCQQKCSKSVL